MNPIVQVPQTDQSKYTSRTRARRVAEVSRFKTCNAVDPKTRFACRRWRTSDLLSQMGKPFLNSSKDFSPLVNSFQRPSFLCTSSWLSSTLFSSLSSPLNSIQLVLTHLTSVPPVNFSQPSQTDTVANFLVLASWIAFPSDHGFNIRLCYNSRVMCYHTILLDCWLLAAAFLPRARRAVTSRAAICQERAWAAQPHKSTQAAKLSYKGTFRQRKLSTLH